MRIRYRDKLGRYAKKRQNKFLRPFAVDQKGRTLRAGKLRRGWSPRNEAKLLREAKKIEAAAVARRIREKLTSEEIRKHGETVEAYFPYAEDVTLDHVEGLATFHKVTISSEDNSYKVRLTVRRTPLVPSIKVVKREVRSAVDPAWSEMSKRWGHPDRTHV